MYWNKLPGWINEPLCFISKCLNPPTIGALVGCIIGLIPSLHRAFTYPPQEGGIFRAWLTTSLMNMGVLFVPLSLMVVGISLNSSFEKMQKRENSGNMSLGVMFSVLAIRFVVWPLYVPLTPLCPTPMPKSKTHKIYCLTALHRFSVFPVPFLC
jgi:predicted permease